MGNHIVTEQNFGNRPDICYKVFKYLPKDRGNKKLMIEWVKKCFIVNPNTTNLIKFLEQEEIRTRNVRYRYSEAKQKLFIYIHCYDNDERKDITKALNSSWMDDNLE